MVLKLRYYILFGIAVATQFASAGYRGTETVEKYTWTYWIYDSGQCEIENVSPKPSGVVVVPTRLGGHVVTLIGCDADFDVTSDDLNWSGCTSLVLGEGVRMAYLNDISSLVSLDVPESMEYLVYGGDGMRIGYAPKIEKVVFRGAVPWSYFLPAQLMWINSIYYSSSYATEWKKVLRNFGYGGTHGVYKSSQKTLMTAMVASASQYATSETPDLGPFVVGIEAEQTMATAAGKSMTGVPSGLTWDKASGTLSGTAKKAGTYTVTVGGEKMTVRIDPNPESTEAIDCTVTFDANGGTCATTSRQISDRAAVGELPTATRSNYDFLGWFTAAVDGEQVSSETVVTADVTWYAQWKAQETDVPTYGPWGESEDVKNPDRLGPTMLVGMPVTVDGKAAAQGDVVAVFRNDTSALCGLGKAIDDSGKVTVVCYAPTGVDLSFRVWIAASGITNPTICVCSEAYVLTAPTVGSIVDDCTLAARTVELAMDRYEVCYRDGNRRVVREYLCNKVYAMERDVFTPPSGKTFAGWLGSNGKRYDDGVLTFNAISGGKTLTLTAIWE